jgi:hypothetical protein
MSLSLDNGELPIAVIKGSNNSDGRKLYANTYDGALIDINLMDGMFQQIPHPEWRNVLFAWGSSGAGKSTYIASFVRQWLAMMKPKILSHKRRDLDPEEAPGQVYMISRKGEGEDKAFADIPMKHIAIDDSLIDEPLNSSDFPENSMLIFDDISSIQPKKLAQSIQGLMRDVLEVGRARNINTCISNHLGADHNNTKTVLNEATHIIIYPRVVSNT